MIFAQKKHALSAFVLQVNAKWFIVYADFMVFDKQRSTLVKAFGSPAYMRDVLNTLSVLFIDFSDLY